MKKPVGCILKALAISVVSTSVHAAVIGFEGTVAHGAQFATYTEDGFTVTAGSTLWTNNRVYGAPAPVVQYYRNKADPEIVTGLFVSADGADFTFASVDVYNSLSDELATTFIGLAAKEDWARFAAFVGTADMADAGDSAARLHLAFPVAHLAEAVLGPGEWAPTPDRWTDGTERGQF
jgi:hypothetical protein